MKYLKTILIFSLVFFLLAGCSSASPAKTAEENFKGLSAGLFGEKAQALDADIHDIIEDSPIADASLNSEREGMVVLDNTEYIKRFQEAFGAYATDDCINTIMINQTYFPVDGVVDSISFAPATDNRTNYSMTVILQDVSQQEYSFDLSGSFQYDKNGKITYFKILDIQELTEFVGTNRAE